MDFGRVPDNQVDLVNFSLPAEPAFNKKILKGKKAAHPKVYVGCAKWGRKEWVGKIYPKGTKDAQFLDHYVKHYNSIELNATHYKIQPPAQIKQWSDKAEGRDFIFCPKVPQAISHFSGFGEKAQALTNSFLEGVYEFGDHLGPIFLQVSERYAPARKESLIAYLQLLPKDLQFFLEVRHPEWFLNETSEDLFTVLKKIKIGAVITDTAGRRDCCHMHLTVPKAFIRFVGNSLHKTDFTRIDEWVERIKYWLSNGLQELYFFMHMHDEATSPELTVYLVDKLNPACGLELIKPEFEKQGKLF
ncbi:MAG: hypothetical protein JWN76_73 [Chitinophagaceae bacterium]|nr:hypothetical protein [Chitinophagaceae bacterium]